jgi:Ras-related protein Rab-5C
MKGRAAASTDLTPATFKGKVVIIGEYSVGKTSLCQRFVNRVVGKTEPTIGAAFQVKTVPLPNSTQTVKLEIWDTAGSERYRSLMPMYYRDSSVAVICYDITNSKSFERVPVWVEDFRKHADSSSLAGGGVSPTSGGGGSAKGTAGETAGVVGQQLMLLVGTKADLANNLQETKRQVDAQAAASFARQEGMVFFETSAKTDMNVVDVFMQAALHISRTRRAGDGGGVGGGSNAKGGGNQQLIGAGPAGRKIDLRRKPGADENDEENSSKKCC